MKVLHVLAELQFSGAELMLYAANDKFASSNLHTTVLSTGKSEGVYAAYFRSLQWDVSHIPFEKSFSFYSKLRRFIKQGRFDVIHIHTESAFIYNAVVAFISGTKKIVRTVHNNFEFSGYLRLRRKAHHFIAQKLLKIDFISISISVKNTEKNIYKTETTLINNWIDIDKFRKKQIDGTAAAADDIRIVSVGKCTSVKNHQAILELVSLLKNSGHFCHYTHIGTGELEEEEKQWVRDNNLDESVTYVGNTDRVNEYLANNNFYLMPSRFEGLGNACLEAMVSGIFCIVNDCPGLNTLISNGTTGLVVNFDDIPSVADQLISVSKNKTQYDKIVKSAQSYVAEKYSLKNIDKMIEIYNS